MLRSVCIAGIIVAATATSGFAGVTAAEYLPDASAYGGSLSLGITINTNNHNIHGGQTFLAMQSGLLQSITIRAFRQNAAVENLQIELYSLDAQGTLETLLAAGEIDIANNAFTGVSQQYTADLSDPRVQVRAGTQYAIVIGQANGWDRDTQPASWSLPFVSGGGGYADGDSIQSNNGGANFFGPLGRDFGFRVTVPAPAAAGMMALTGLIATRRRRG